LDSDLESTAEAEGLGIDTNETDCTLFVIWFDAIQTSFTSPNAHRTALFAPSKREADACLRASSRWTQASRSCYQRCRDVPHDPWNSLRSRLRTSQGGKSLSPLNLCHTHSTIFTSDDMISRMASKLSR
jgi:hypothetical protein